MLYLDSPQPLSLRCAAQHLKRGAFTLRAESDKCCEKIDELGVFDSPLPIVIGISLWLSPERGAF